MLVLSLPMFLDFWPVLLSNACLYDPSAVLWLKCLWTLAFECFLAHVQHKATSQQASLSAREHASWESWLQSWPPSPQVHWAKVSSQLVSAFWGRGRPWEDHHVPQVLGWTWGGMHSVPKISETQQDSLSEWLQKLQGQGFENCFFLFFVYTFWVFLT